MTGNDIPFNENRGYVKQLGDDLSGRYGSANTVTDGFSPHARDFVAAKFEITGQPDLTADTLDV